MTQFKVTAKIDGKKTSKIYDSNQTSRKAYNKLEKAVEEEGLGFARLESREENSEDWSILNEITLEEEDN